MSGFQLGDWLFDQYIDQITASELSPILERQLLLQLGDRIKRLRKAQGLGTVEVSARAKLTRNTLRSIEAGDPSPSIGAYLRVMSVLGVSAVLALLAGDTMQASPAGSAGAQSRRLAPTYKYAFCQITPGIVFKIYKALPCMKQLFSWWRLIPHCYYKLKIP